MVLGFLYLNPRKSYDLLLDPPNQAVHNEPTLVDFENTVLWVITTSFDDIMTSLHDFVPHIG